MLRKRGLLVVVSLVRATPLANALLSGPKGGNREYDCGQFHFGAVRKFRGLVLIVEWMRVFKPRYVIAIFTAPDGPGMDAAAELFCSGYR
jgi:hypothetical protein